MSLNVLATGIEFTPQGGSSVNLLDDYEEGTGTPSVTGTAGACTYSGSTTGFYSKVGRLMNISIYFRLTGFGSNGTGDIAKCSLPVTAHASGSLFCPIPMSNIQRVDIPGANQTLTAFVNPGASNMEWRLNTTSDGASCTLATLTTNAIMRAGGTYAVA